MPYGEELSGASNYEVKFATYTRDGSTGLDYADQRYYSSLYGRFLSADRFQGAAKVWDSGSWNKYLYTRGDPVGRMDRSGQADCPVDTCVDVSDSPEPDPQFPFQQRNQPNDPIHTNPASAKYSGFDLAVGAIKGPCANDVIGNSGFSGQQAVNRLLTTAIVPTDYGAPIVTQSTDPSGEMLYLYSVKVAQARGGIIFVNQNFFADPTLQNVKVGDKSLSVLDLFNNEYGTKFSTSDFQELFFLHELSHALGRADDQNSLQDSEKFNKQLIQDCFKK